jgi:hypothetical protein
MTKKTKMDDRTTVISYKLANEPYEELLRYAKSQTDEMGNELSPSQAARRLMLEALKRQKKN